MRKTSPDVEKKALRAWLEGKTQREAAQESGIGVATVNRVVEEARKRTPDIDGLRELNVALKKSGAPLTDAVRGARLLERLNDLGVGLERLASYLALAETVSQERGVGATGLVEAAMRLMELEKQVGKPYGEVLKDFEERRRLVEGLEDRAKNLQEEGQKLADAKARLEGEIRGGEERLSQVRRGLEDAVSTQERLSRLGLDKVGSLAEFVEAYERLGFNAEEVQRLAAWRKSLEAWKIDPDRLGEYIKERGSLEGQISKLLHERSAGEEKTRRLNAEHLRLWSQVNALKEKVSGLSTLATVLKERKVLMTCKVCGASAAVLMKVPSRKEFEAMMREGLVAHAGCLRCGGGPSYTAYDILYQIGWMALPE